MASDRPVAVKEYLSGRTWHLHGDTIYQPDYAGICMGCLDQEPPKAEPKCICVAGLVRNVQCPAHGVLGKG